jgi:signal transduction histidine kinase
MADFLYADDFRLGQSPTRRFYEFFLKGYIHKHNNLMGVIQGFSSLILFDDSINEEVRESAEQMQTSAKAATDLNREILGATGCARCEIAPMRIPDALTYWKGKAEDICAPLGFAAEWNVREPLPPVLADSTRLGEVFFHLMRNAAEAAAGVRAALSRWIFFPRAKRVRAARLISSSAIAVVKSRKRRCAAFSSPSSHPRARNISELALPQHRSSPET